MRPVTRRGALRGALALAVSGVAAQLGTTPARAQAPPADPGVIRSALGFEERSALAYRTAARSGLLGASLQDLVDRIGRQESQHAAALRTALEALGAPPPRPPAPIAELAAARSEREVAEYLLGLESASVAAYQRALRTLTVPPLVETAASIMAVEAQHLVLIRRALGRESVRGPFERG
jgi:hypothetical protein